MNINIYCKQFLFAFLFYLLALIPVWLHDGFNWNNSNFFYLLYLTYSILSALFYPFCLAQVEAWKKGVSESIYWFNGGLFIICILFAIPLGIYYVIRKKWG